MTCAVVAVATGDGIRRIFHSLGVQGIVTGGQSMNPSTAELLAAVEAVPADQVVILPEQQEHHPGGRAGRRADRRRPCVVVPTKGITEGFAALLAYDPEADADENAAEMAEAADNVVAGEVTQAVRASSCDVGPIAEGDWLGSAATGIRAVEAQLGDAATVLLEVLVDRAPRDRHDHRGRGRVGRRTPGASPSGWPSTGPAPTAEVHHGGQPLYPYLFGIE